MPDADMIMAAYLVGIVYIRRYHLEIPRFSNRYETRGATSVTLIDLPSTALLSLFAIDLNEDGREQKASKEMGCADYSQWLLRPR